MILILGTKYCQYSENISQNRELSEYFLVIYQIKRSYVDLITNLKVWKRYLRDVLVLLIFMSIHGAAIARRIISCDLLLHFVLTSCRDNL